MKVQQTNPSFGAKWVDARKVLHSLPEDHEIFSHFNYTLDGITHARKEVFLKRLDRANEEIQAKIKEYKVTPRYIVNLVLPPIKTLFKKPKAFFKSLREQFVLHHSDAGLAYNPESCVYPFERKILIHKNNYQETTILKTHKNDSIGTVTNLLLRKGDILFKEFKKAGLEDPHKISF